MNAASTIDMATACYYTFSTVCQTLAGAFGFLVAVVVYMMQRNDKLLQDQVGFAEYGRELSDPRGFIRAREKGDWKAVAAILRNAPYSSGAPQKDQPQADIDRDNWIRVFDKQDATMDRLKKALVTTGVVIAVSLLLIPLSPYIARLGIFTWVILVTDWFFAAVVCLSMYYDLARGVVE